MKKISALVLGGAVMALASSPIYAATGEMGTGVPNFGIYSQATGMSIIVWSLGNATRSFPSGCTNIVLTPATMGMDSYKMAMATLTAARVSGLKVRFYAHAERDNGCGVDYVQLED
jgi:hypothetical protein